jgi:hypothetical protein
MSKNYVLFRQSLMTAYLGDYEKIEKKLNKEKRSLME